VKGRAAIGWIAVGAGTVVIAGLAFVRSRPPVNEHAAEVEQIVETAHRHYRELPIWRWADSAPPGDRRASLQSVIERMRFTVAPDAAPAFAQARAELLSSVQGFLESAVVDRDLAGYTRWRRSRGDRLRTMADMNRSWFIEQDWERDFGEPMPPGTDERAAFERHWEAWRAKAEADSLPVAIVDAPDGLECSVAIVESLLGQHRPVMGGPLGRAGWTGGRGGTARMWWTHERSGLALLEEYGRVMCAEVGVVVEYANAARHPLVTTWVYDPAERTWRLEFVCVYNWDGQRQVRSMEY
jgi:hypothetical protein